MSCMLVCAPDILRGQLAVWEVAQPRPVQVGLREGVAGADRRQGRKGATDGVQLRTKHHATTRVQTHRHDGCQDICMVATLGHG
eukprot:1143792-Pelagomonas_calceolata.AAC.5